MNIGSRIRTLRGDKGMTLRALSRASGVDTGTLCRIENGETTSPRYGTLEKVASALDMKLADLFAQQGQPGEEAA